MDTGSGSIRSTNGVTSSLTESAKSSQECEAPLMVFVKSWFRHIYEMTHRYKYRYIYRYIYNSVISQGNSLSLALAVKEDSISVTFPSIVQWVVDIWPLRSGFVDVPETARHCCHWQWEQDVAQAKELVQLTVKGSLNFKDCKFLEFTSKWSELCDYFILAYVV